MIVIVYKGRHCNGKISRSSCPFALQVNKYQLPHTKTSWGRQKNVTPPTVLPLNCFATRTTLGEPKGTLRNYKPKRVPRCNCAASCSCSCRGVNFPLGTMTEHSHLCVGM